MKATALKQKILDYAIAGKLTSPAQNDESAYVLLERIHNQRQQMVNIGELNAKYIKNHTVIFKGEDNLHYERLKNESIKCVENEIPFSEPEGWAWCRLKELFCVCSAKRILKSDWTKEGIPFYRAREIAKLSDTKESGCELFISKEHYNKLAIENSIPHAGDLMVSAVGTIGKVYVVNNKDCFYYKDASVLCLENRSGMINPQYAKYMLESSFLQEQMKANSKGTTVDTITISAAMEYMCLLPPLNEQLQIVTAIENALKYIKQIQDEQSQLRELITAAKTKILNLAVHGKLVSQDPLDEPASVLLSRIKNEKASLIASGQLKENKKEAVILKGDDNSYYEKFAEKIQTIDNEIPFTLPSGWVWCRLSDIAEIVMGASPKGENLCNDSEFMEFHQGKIYFSEKTISPSHKYTMEITKIASAGSVLCSVRAPVGDVNITDREICIGRGLAAIKVFTDISSLFLFYWLSALKHELISKAVGTTFKSITSNNIKNLLIPLPPVKEQNLILKKISSFEEMLSSIEKAIS